MKIIQKTFRVDASDYHSMHLSLINPALEKKMTNKEIEVLASFMSLDSSITGTDMFNTYARKLAKSKLKGMSSGSLSNHIKSLLDKGLLKKDENSNRISIGSFLFPEEDQQGYQFKLIKNK